MKGKKKMAAVAADSKSDKKMVKAGVGQHESNMHKGKGKTNLKLGK